MRRATGSYDRMQEISISFLFILVYVIYLFIYHQNEKVWFPSLSSRGSGAKTTESCHFVGRVDCSEEAS